MENAAQIFFEQRTFQFNVDQNKSTLLLASH